MMDSWLDISLSSFVRLGSLMRFFLWNTVFVKCSFYRLCIFNVSCFLRYLCGPLEVSELSQLFVQHMIMIVWLPPRLEKMFAHCHSLKSCWSKRCLQPCKTKNWELNCVWTFSILMLERWFGTDWESFDFNMIKYREDPKNAPNLPNTTSNLKLADKIIHSDSPQQGHVTVTPVSSFWKGHVWWKYSCHSGGLA